MKQKIRELRAQGLTLQKIKDICKESFGRETLSLETIHRALKESSPIEVSKDYLQEEYQDKVFKQWTKARNDTINSALKFKASCDLVGEYFKNLFKECDVPKFKGKIPTPKKKGKVGIVAIGDLHYGRTTEDLIENMVQLAEDIKSSDYKEIILIVLWDLFETPILTAMHDWQIEELDILGVKQVIWCMNLLYETILSILNSGIKVSVIWLTGNHDRFSKSPESDPQRIVGTLGYEYLKERLGGKVKIDYLSNKLYNKEVLGTNLILHHWDNGFNNQVDNKVLSTYWKIGMFNIIMSGHYHTASLTTGTQYMRIQIPSMNSPSSYELNQFMSRGKSGYVTIEIGDSINPSFIYFKDKKNETRSILS